MIEAILTTVVAKYAPAVGFLLVLVAVDLVTGIASALKRKKFEWEKVADFYSSTLAPLVLGWLGVVLLVEAAIALQTPAEWIGLVSVGGVWTLYLLALGKLAASIYANLKEISGGVLPPAA